jgi:type VI secretion system protein ImpH
MAGQIRESSFNLKLSLLNNGRAFSFYQALRLLRLFQEESESLEEKQALEQQNLRIRPELSLSFPASDVVKIEEVIVEDKSHFCITATMLGLYGASSPLPTFYTEDLLEEEGEDQSVARDFMDIFNHRLYLLLFRCWMKYRGYLQLVEENNSNHLGKLFCLIGLGEEELRKDLGESYPFLRYTGLFTQFPRSAQGLQTLLQDALGGILIEVLPCIQRKVRIPEDQRLRVGSLGNSLGGNTMIGEEMDDRMGKFRLRIGPLRREQFHSFLPGGPDHGKLVSLTRFYLEDPLEYDLMLILAEGESGTTCLGAPMMSKLGWDTWVFSESHLGEVGAIFPPYYQ